MIKPKFKNKISAYRKLTGMTQSEAAKLLNEGKSNISNMESENGHYTKDYLDILNITENELNTSPFPILPLLRQEHPKSTSSASGRTYESSSQKYGILSEDDTTYIPQIGFDKDKNTTFYSYKCDRDYITLDIKQDAVIIAYPKLKYTAKKYVLCRASYSSYFIGKILNKNEILCLTNDTIYDMQTTEIIGEIKRP